MKEMPERVRLHDGLVLTPKAGNPSVLETGMLWHNSTTGRTMFRQNSTSLRLGGFLVAERKSNTATGSGFQTVFSVSIPGGTFGTDRGIRWHGDYRRTTGSGNLVWRVVYGSTSVFGSFTADSGASGAVYGRLRGAGATNAQRGQCVQTRSVIPVAGSSAEDSTGALTLSIDVDLATDADVVTADWFEVEII